MASITPAQCRAARGLLGWTQRELALKAEVSEVPIRNFELGRSTNRATLKAIVLALEGGGVAFIEPGFGMGEGVRWREGEASDHETL